MVMPLRCTLAGYVEQQDVPITASIAQLSKCLQEQR